MKRIAGFSILLCAIFLAVSEAGRPNLVLADEEPTIISGHLDEAYSITEPGNYIVVGETGPIIVNASDVQLNLNGGIVHQVEGVSVFGIIVERFQSNVHINGPGTVMCESEKTGGIGLSTFTSDNHVNGVYVKDCQYWGFLVGGSSNKINGNIVDGSSTCYVISGSGGHRIIGNTVTNCGTGLVIEASNGSVFKSNVMNDNVWWGIRVLTRFSTPINNRFIGNTAINNGEMDIEDQNGNCDANTWRGNTFNTSDPDCIR